MKLRTLEITNFRCFEVLTVEFHQQLTVIVADNGVGKTSILDAIAIAFGRLLTKLPKVKGVSFKDTDLRLLENGKPAASVYYWVDATDFSGESIQWSNGKKRDSSQKTRKEILDAISNLEKFKAGYKQIDQLADSLIDKHNSDEGYYMPVIAYYGTNRAIIDEVQRRRNFRKEYSRFESLVFALTPNTRFKEVFEWFNAMEDIERRKQQEMKNFDYKLPELNTIRRAIESMLPNYSHPRTETRPIRFVIDRTLDDGNKQTLRLTQLSDGYRVMLGLVMDLARRLAQANPPYVHDCGGELDITDPLNTPAVVLIDEVDLHLHPKWQQTILPDLMRTFPNTQFIVTTHSPQVLSTVHPESIRILGKNSEGKDVAALPIANSYGAISSDVLQSIMHVDPQPPVAEKTDLDRLTELVDQERYESPEVKALFEKLQTAFGETHPHLQKLHRSIKRQKMLKL